MLTKKGLSDHLPVKAVFSGVVSPGCGDRIPSWMSRTPQYATMLREEIQNQQIDPEDEDAADLICD
eukprot:5238256-Alexandrium_andersonii.AAC.1